ncbi:hypothetical protein [Pseudothioclava nitratireducens]|jgi:hypothetical protein|uniref:hypothetical protein n=1 Tax=Pseudothioclava nitratireducens TaxID=1928646 RepID=UPI0023DC82E9|nr:hypothetical protein [Defluviimonas nitratireducens]MDF1619840.1 hypothetical protein [Defluviimonas nitratireducens]
MKRIALSLALVITTATSAMAGGVSFDLPRMDFGGQGGEVTQGCNSLTQTCADD